MEKSGSAIVVFSGWFLRKRVKQDEPEAIKTCGPVATGRPVRAMLPCEMGRYIAGFSREARKYGVFRSSFGRLNSESGCRKLEPAEWRSGGVASLTRATKLATCLTIVHRARTFSIKRIGSMRRTD